MSLELVKMGLYGLLIGAGTALSDRCVFVGYRRLEADPGLAEHTLDVDRLIIPQPDDIFEKYGDRFRIWDCADFPSNGLEFPEHLGRIPPLIAQGPPAIPGFTTDPLIPEGIGTHRVDKAIQVDPSVFSGTGGYLRNAGDIIMEADRVFHRRYLAYFPTITNGQYVHGSHDGNTLQTYVNQGSTDRIFGYCRDDANGTSNPAVMSWMAPPQWILIDWVFDPATGNHIAYANGMEDDEPGGGPRGVVLSGQLGILGTRNATSSPDHHMVWLGWRHLDSAAEFTLADHLVDLGEIGIPVMTGATRGVDDGTRPHDPADL